MAENRRESEERKEGSEGSQPEAKRGVSTGARQLGAEMPEPEEPPRFKFSDRRFWVREQEGEEENEEVSSDKPTYVQQLESRVEGAEKKLADYVRAYKQEVNVEWEKSKQRIEREAKKSVDRERRTMVAELLEILDLIDVSLDKAEKSHDIDSLLAGFSLIRSEFLRKLQGLGLEEILAEGERFDPIKHEAVSVEETSDDSRDGLVSNVYQPGYYLDGELVRPARVRVARKA